MNFKEYDGYDHYNENEYSRMFEPIDKLTNFSDSNTTKNFIDVHNVYWKYIYDCHMNQPEIIKLKLEHENSKLKLEQENLKLEHENLKLKLELEKYKYNGEFENK
jgi:hypothetical protein